MTKPQIIRTESGEELVVLSRRDYDELLKHQLLETDENDEVDPEEDAGIARIIERGEAALARGDEIILPAEVAEPIIRGDNPIRVVREWRGVTQAQLGEMTEGLSQAYISQLESGERQATVETLRKIARALRVPLSLLVPD